VTRSARRGDTRPEITCSASAETLCARDRQQRDALPPGGDPPDNDDAAMTDSGIIEQIVEALLSAGGFAGALVVVTCEQGVVTLHGRVDRRKHRRELAALAEAQPEVVRVINNLTVRPDAVSEILRSRCPRFERYFDSEPMPASDEPPGLAATATEERS